MVERGLVARGVLRAARVRTIWFGLEVSVIAVMLGLELS